MSRRPQGGGGARKLKKKRTCSRSNWKNQVSHRGITDHCNSSPRDSCYRQPTHPNNGYSPSRGHMLPCATHTQNRQIHRLLHVRKKWGYEQLSIAVPKFILAIRVADICKELPTAGISHLRSGRGRGGGRGTPFLDQHLGLVERRTGGAVASPHLVSGEEETRPQHVE